MYVFRYLELHPSNPPVSGFWENYDIIRIHAQSSLRVTLYEKPHSPSLLHQPRSMLPEQHSHCIPLTSIAAAVAALVSSVCPSVIYMPYMYTTLGGRLFYRRGGTVALWDRAPDDPQWYDRY